jgi:DNA-binding helix-hairpin-helix protein with protein kinase domain
MSRTYAAGSFSRARRIAAAPWSSRGSVFACVSWPARLAIRLGAVLGRGGEGAVYETSFDTNMVAKVYHAALSPVKADKIRVMASLRNDRLTRLTAWPIDLLSLDGSRTPIGLLMPKVAQRKDIHYLYSPKSRRAEFRRADWRFLIRAAANTARAFQVVHEAGCVIGDVNHGGVLVRSRRYGTADRLRQLSDNDAKAPFSL